ncbi:MAG: hypothetical protein FD149_782 [Rhodospirillaceae bacterium]|nr:MAG: hypothetical protein FD149_782 [Rhodospirillaceae bacterium]
MTPKTFIVVGAITMASLVAAAGAGRPVFHPTEEGGAAVFPGLVDTIDSIARLTIRSPEGSLTIERSGSGWSLKERDGYPVDGAIVRTVIVEMVRAVLLEPKTAKPERHALLDLVAPDDPAVPKGRGRELTVQDTSGTTLAALVIGKHRSDLGGTGGEEEGIYVRRPGENQTWLARTGLFPATKPGGWVNPSVVAIDSARVARVTFRPSDGPSFTVNQPPAPALSDNAPVDEGAVRRVLALLSGVTLDDVRKGNAIPLGAAKPPRVEVSTRDGLVVTLTVHEHDKATWIAVSAQGTGGLKAEADTINDRTGGWLYRIPAHTAATLRTRREDLLRKEADEDAS